MKFNKLYLIIPLLFLINSCAAFIVGGAVGVGAVVYEKGQLTAHEGTGYDETLAAVLKAMEQLGYTVEKTEKSMAKEKVIAKTPEGDKYIPPLGTNRQTILKLQLGLVHLATKNFQGKSLTK